MVAAQSFRTEPGALLDGELIECRGEAVAMTAPRSLWWAAVFAAIGIGGVLFTDRGAAPAAAEITEGGKRREAAKQRRADASKARRGAKNGKSKGENEIHWLSLADGLQAMRLKKRVGLLVFAPDGVDRQTSKDSGDGDGDEAAGADAASSVSPGALSTSVAQVLEDHLSSRALRAYVAKRCVFIRVRPGDLNGSWPKLERKPALEARSRGCVKLLAPEDRAKLDPLSTQQKVLNRLQLVSDQAAVLLLSHRELPVKRYEKKLPRPRQFREQVSRVAKVNKIHAANALKIEPILEKSLYTFSAGKRKQAVLAVVELQKPKRQRNMDELVKKQLIAVVEKYRGVATKEMDAADKLDRGGKYDQALIAYERVLQDFAFRDIRKRAAIRKGEIARKLQLTTTRRGR